MPDIDIEVVFALPDAQQIRRIRMPAPCTAGEAIKTSGLTAGGLQADGSCLQLAVFGRLITAATLLRDGDRVEILRSLIADPKERRREKVRAAATARRRL